MRVNRIGVRLLAALAAAAILFGGALPALAQPGAEIPNEGARPLGEETGETPVTNPESAGGPLAEEIDRAQIDVAQLAEEVTAAEEEFVARSERLALAQTAWIEAASELETAQNQLDEAVGEAYADMSGTPDTELPDLTGLTPVGEEWDLPGLTSAVEETDTAESVARAAYDAATESASRAEGRYTNLDEEYDKAQEELDDLIEENAEELAEIEEAREEAAAQYSDDFSAEVDGWKPAPEAVKAVEFALAQLGKPYEWGAEGPETFDCSGLTQTAYAKAGVSLPRVAKDQFWATRDKPIDTSMLLPGDLLFWWDVHGDWSSVYHMGMYIGDGKMVQAPRTGDVVKISSIWFSNFAGGHRVVDAIKTDPDAKDPSGDNGDSPSPTPTDDEPSDPSPTPSETPSRDPEPSPTPSPSPSPTPSPTPSDEPSPSEEPPSEDTEDESPQSPSPTLSETISGTLSRDPETGESSGELSEGGYRVRLGDGTMVARLPVNFDAPSPRRLPWTTTAAAHAVST